MGKKVIFIISIFMGIIFVLIQTKAKELMAENSSNEVDTLETVTCINEYDSAILRQKQDSVVRFGNKLCSEDLWYYYSHIHCGLYDNFFYSMVMMNKYNDTDSYGLAFQFPDELLEKININGFMGKMTIYYLLKGAKMGDWNSCSKLEDFYNKGILFQKDRKKALYYEKIADKIDEIKWIK